MKRLIGPLAIGLLLTANLVMATAASAHRWENWHWNRYGSSVTIKAYNTAYYRTEASRAIKDWSSNTILYIPEVDEHTDISVFDGNYGDTGWVGLAEIINNSGSHILHGHARLNYYYNYSSNSKQGTFCQEVGHLFDLDHSDDGSCMGWGYYRSATNHTVEHNWNDIYNMYRRSHH